ncbi:MAG: type I restriction-modification system subunit M [Paracoccaceae bacterium]|nr:type I restriction-modification system subunit M [Paracoccaceae bacterium]MDE2673640.1 type I restriction-modification system subunit M [Paracoccaceae bacterium]
MAIKKSMLYSSLWKSCDELRGGMDASQYKDYVLTLLFIKYVSDKYSGKTDSLIEIPVGGSFADLVSLKGDKEIGDKINKAIGKLAETNDLKGVIDVADFNDEDKLGKGREMQDRLSKLVSIFNDLDFRSNRTEGDDLLGDAYEYLMRHFATESGKSKGQFYTPAEVSRIMAKVISIDKETSQDQTVYDPTCGSGSLLLKAADEAPNGLSIYGQEKDVSTTALAKMNMFLHDNPTADIAPGGSSTLSDPAFVQSASELKIFDFIVANPPFSSKSWQNGFAKDEKKKTITDPYGRFDYGVPPSRNGDYAFLLHIIRSLKSTGKGAVILPHGVLFRGNAEATIRKEIIKRGYINCIIGLPANLFYGTGIPACIIVLDKEHADTRKGIFMIDASKGFIKDGNKNRLRFQDIHKIVDVFNNRFEIEGFSRMVHISEISDQKNDFNLNLPRYIYGSNEVDIHDLTAHFKGGIPKGDIDIMQRYWDVFKDTRKMLFKQNGSTDYLITCVPSHKVKSAILNSADYKEFSKKAETVLKSWKVKYEPYLKSLGRGCKPKDVIVEISEDLLEAFSTMPLIDRYDVYQHMMNYWLEVMQDDVYQISVAGWEDIVLIRSINFQRDRQVKETPDIIVGSGKKAQKFKTELIPPELIVQRYFADEKQAIDELEARCETVVQEIEELLEEHSREEGLLEDIKNDNGKLTKTKVKNRINEIKFEVDFEDEMMVLKQLQNLYDQEGNLASKIKTRQLELNKNTATRYAKLDIDEIKELVVIDKWFACLNTFVDTEIERVTQILANKVKVLEERYANPIQELTKQVSESALRVEEHLKKLGVNC